jgi:hypothetical protein
MVIALVEMLREFVERRMRCFYAAMDSASQHRMILFLGRVW